MRFTTYSEVSTANHIDTDSEILTIGNLTFQYQSGSRGGIAFGAKVDSIAIQGWYQTYYDNSGNSSVAIKDTALTTNLVVLGNANISKKNEWRFVTLTTTDINDDLTYEIYCTRTNDKIVLKGRII